MSDHEILELAARAAGITVQYSNNFGDFSIGEPYSADERRWNPLNDDGDALRLAVTLGLSLVFDCAPMTLRDLYGKSFRIRIWCVSGWIKEDFSNDSRSEYVRRAIVRAAAEIGRSMP